MNTSSRIYLTLFGIAILFSCVNAEKKAHLETIDAMQVELDSMENAFKKAHLDSIIIIRDDASAIEKDVKTYFMEDTIDKAFAEKMLRLRDIRKSKRYISKRKSFLDTIFVFQKAQLEKLRHDIENDAGKRDEYKKFIDSEKSNVLVIRNTLQEFEKKYAIMRLNYYDVAEAIRERVKPFKEKALMQ
jgi:hypothetical protein